MLNPIGGGEGEGDPRNQSILVSGESGSGKTEVCVYVCIWCVGVDGASLC